jgi:thiamine pyrophosphate-dependent acetolactate synthase large subunit-like protein
VEGAADASGNVISSLKWAGEKNSQEKRFEDAIDSLTSRAKVEKRPEIASEILDGYAKYIKWTRDTYTSNSDKALKLLERCTYELKNEETLKNDLKFVKMWIEYVSSNTNCCNAEVITLHLTPFFSLFI